MDSAKKVWAPHIRSATLMTAKSSAPNLEVHGKATGGNHPVNMAGGQHRVVAPVDAALK